MANDKKLKDRTLEIMVTPTLSWFENTVLGAFVTYVQTNAEPDMYAVTNQLSGYIDISNMPFNREYNDNVDITFTLNTDYMKDQNGNDLHGRFAKDGEGPLPGEGALWFCNPPKNGFKDPTPISIPGMTIIRKSDTEVLINDETPLAAPPYTFCIGIILPPRGNEFVLIDPLISTRGVQSEAPGR